LKDRISTTVPTKFERKGKGLVLLHPLKEILPVTLSDLIDEDV